MKRRPYGRTTKVAIEKSRGEIDRLLREFDAKSIQWTDNLDENTSTLRYIWTHEGNDYLARFTINLDPIDEDDALDLRTGEVSANKLGKLRANQGKQEHRLLLLWLKASLNAVDAGLVDAATIFLPWLEDKHGSTVADVILPKLSLLTTGRATRLLPAHKKGS